MYESLVLIIKVTFFLWWIHFIPPLLSVMMGSKWNLPVDLDYPFIDGKPILGKHKTIRGVVGSIIGSATVAPAFGWSIFEGFILALAGVIGDLLTSFIKRRLNKPSGTIIPLLDQIPEGLLPLLLLKQWNQITLFLLVVILVIFSLGAYLGSIFYKQILLVKPINTYPRTLTPRLRLREWKACQIKSNPLRFLLNFEDAVHYRLLLKGILKLSGYYHRGVKNALDIQIRTVTLYFRNLPSAFNGYSILFLTDLHINGHDELAERLSSTLEQVPESDLCILGGDYRMEDVGMYHSPFTQLARIIPVVHGKTRDGVIAVLGNHDCIEMVTWFEKNGVKVLINEHIPILKDADLIYVVGVDDPHYFRCHDIEEAFRGVPAGAFSIFVAHSPEVYREAEMAGASLYLCGHTHAGQIQFPRIGALFTHSRTGWRFVYGLWKYKNMMGYTSSGVGASGIFVRFNTKGEIVRFILFKEGEDGHDIKRV